MSRKISPLLFAVLFTLSASGSFLSLRAGAQATGSISGVVDAPARLRANAVVYVDHANGHFAAPSAPVSLDQRGMRFLPRVLPVLVGTTVRFDNHDPTQHNVFSPDNGGYDLGMFGQNQTANHRFDRAGVYTQLCHVHPEMIAFVIVLQNPYYAVTDASGNFRIPNVPAGSYHMLAWQEHGHGGPVDAVVHAGADTSVHVPVGH